MSNLGEIDLEQPPKRAEVPGLMGARPHVPFVNGPHGEGCLGNFYARNIWPERGDRTSKHSPQMESRTQRLSIMSRLMRSAVIEALPNQPNRTDC